MSGSGGVGGVALRYVSVRLARGELVASSAKTIQVTLWHFAATVGVDLSPSKLNRRHVERWLDGRTLAASSRRAELSQLRTFCRWMVDERIIRRDPTTGVARVRMPRYLPRGLRPEPVADLLAECPDARAALIVTLMVQEGLRCVEVASLQVHDIDLAEMVVLVKGKGGHQRVLPVSEQTRVALSHYLAEHPAHAGPLIRSYTQPGVPLRAKTVSQLVGSWMRSAGVDGTAHALRHTAATDMLRTGAHVRDVQAALGHANPWDDAKVYAVGCRRAKNSDGRAQLRAQRRYPHAMTEVVRCFRCGREIPADARVCRTPSGSRCVYRQGFNVYTPLPSYRTP